MGKTLEQKELDLLSYKIIGAALEVHQILGPGLLESSYEESLCCEFGLRGIKYERQKKIPFFYKGEILDIDYRADIIVEDKIILELKAIDYILPIHEAQLMTYLKLANMRLGLLINFNVFRLKEGINRVVYKF